MSIKTVLEKINKLQCFLNKSLPLLTRIVSS